MLLLLLLGSQSARAQVPAALPAAPAPSPGPAAAPDLPPSSREAAPVATDPAAPADGTAEDTTAELGADEEGRKKRKKRKHRKPTDDDAAPVPALDAARAGNAADKKREKPNKHDFRLKGRVFALAELSHRRERVVTVESGLVDRDRDALDVELQSARIGVDYHSPLPWLSAEVELELAGNVEAKDAFVKAGQLFFVKAGRFKVPAAAMEVASPWTLPQVRRGLVHNLLVDWMDVAGRAPGVAFGYHEKTGLKPRVTLGVFQGSTLKSVLGSDRDVRLIDRATLHAQTYAARAEISPFGIALGAWYEQRVNSIALNRTAHYATFGLDATLDRSFEHSGVRAWIDGGAGQSPYLHSEKPGQGDRAWFTFGRAQLAYRLGGVAQDDPYLEPFGFFAVLDPDTEVVSDLVTEAALGVSAGFWDRARITLQGEITNGQRNFPGGFLGGQTPDHRSLLLQAGARF
ncbi:MAG: uncharacterized protein K0R38_1403 [Polyangiaceae bacterium]|nr:uncharacterized protein [Polyangiaceae bacterium]